MNWSLRYSKTKQVLNLACLLSLSLFLSLTSCTTEHPLKTEFGFLEGDWVSDQGTDTKFYESWHWAHDHWEGTGCTVEQGDTLMVEHISVFAEKSDIFYGANTGSEEWRIDFRLAHDTLGIYIFRNPEHDFPNEIGYETYGTDSMRAWIGGTQGQFDWAFRRRGASGR